MTQLSVSQLANLRKRPQSTKLYLSIYQPKLLFQVRVTGSYNQGDSQINYYSPASGTYFQVYPNLTARIGSTPGADDIGELRVRGITGTYVDFAENEINWKQGQYIAFIDYINIEAVYPRIIQDPSNQTNVLFFKDYSIPYSNQNTNYGTFPCAGPHRAGFIITGAYSTYWSSTGTYNLLGNSLTFSWAFEGGTPTGSTSRDPGFVRYTTPGHYKTRLIVTDASTGVSDTTYRYVSAYQKPNQGTFNPIEAWEISELSGSRGEGGYTARIKIMSILPELQPHALIVIWAEDSYGGNLVSLGGNSQNNESIVFVGYVLQDSIKFNYQYSTMEFDIGSVSEIMKEAEGFSVSCESKATATTWYELQEMTVQKALYHYLRWHSTLLNVNDFQYTGDDRYVQYLDTDRESLFDAVDNFMRKGLLGSLISDRQGKLWAEISSFGLQTPFSTIRSGMTLNKQDWMGDPSIQERRDTDTSFIELGGIAYYGVTTNTFSALISNAPGNAPFYHGKTEREEGLILLSQAQLNQVAANYLAYKNTQYREITMPINGNYRNLDIVPQEQQYLVISPSDTIRQLNIQGNPYQIDSMAWHYDSTQQLFYPDITLEAMATGTMAQTILIPIVPPYQQSGFDYPSLQLPSLPVFNPPSVVGPNAPINVVIHDAINGLLYSTDFDSASPTWQFFNAGLSTLQKQGITFFFQTPNGACFCGHTRDGGGDTDFLARAPSLGGTWTVVFDISNLQSGGSSDWGVKGAGFNPSSPETVGLSLYKTADGAPYFYVGSGPLAAGYTKGAQLETGGYNFYWQTSYVNAKWMVSSYSRVKLISSDGGTASAPAAAVPVDLNPAHVNAGISGITFHDRSGNGIYIAENNFSTVTLNSDTNISMLNSAFPNDNYFAIDPTGYYGMTRYGSSFKGRTSDKGFTWGLITTLVLQNNYYWAYAGGSTTSSRWVVAGGISVFYSDNWGNSWVSKLGNLWTLIPIPNINLVKALGF